MTVTSAPRRLTLRILGDQPATVLLNGTAMPPQESSPGPASHIGWRYDPAAGFIEVAIEHPGGTSTVEYRQA